MKTICFVLLKQCCDPFLSMPKKVKLFSYHSYMFFGRTILSEQLIFIFKTAICETSIQSGQNESRRSEFHGFHSRMYIIFIDSVYIFVIKIGE